MSFCENSFNDRLGRLIFVMLNVSILGLALGFLFSWFPLILLGVTVLIATTWLFAYDFTGMIRVRRRKVLDVIQYHSIVAVGYFTLIITLGIVTALFGWRQLAMLVALGLAAVVGWLEQSIIGYLYKIVPLLIWHARYGPQVGREHVPLMRELVHERWTWASFWLINVGLAGAMLSALLMYVWSLQIACGLLGAGLVLAAANVAGVVRHLDKRYSTTHALQ
jgi:hypothetical protein